MDGCWISRGQGIYLSHRKSILSSALQASIWIPTGSGFWMRLFNRTHRHLRRTPLSRVSRRRITNPELSSNRASDWGYNNYSCVQVHVMRYASLLLPIFLIVGVLANQSRAEELSFGTLMLPQPTPTLLNTEETAIRAYIEASSGEDTEEKSQEAEQTLEYVQLTSVPASQEQNRYGPRALFSRSTRPVLPRPANWSGKIALNLNQSVLENLVQLPTLTATQKGIVQHDLVNSIAEPSLAVRGQQVLITANWSAAHRRARGLPARRFRTIGVRSRLPAGGRWIRTIGPP
jgi:hypothetical protein